MEATKVSEATPEQVHQALAEGALREVVIFCDVCGLEMATDMIGATPEDRFEGARVYLRSHRGWISSEGQDICPFCTAGVRMCTEEMHDFCEHEPWLWDAQTGIAVHPEDQAKFEQARDLALGKESA
jgi:hypothetical protein